MSSGRNNKLVAQIGEFLACAQLGKEELIATPFSGNVPDFDIIATDENCRTVPIQVKTTRSDNWPSDARSWMDVIVDKDGRQCGPDGSCPPPRKAIRNPELIWMCIALGGTGKSDRYFILSKAQIQEACVHGYCSWMGKHDWRRPRNQASFDCRYSITTLLECFSNCENNWALIHERMASTRPSPTLNDSEAAIAQLS